MTISKKAVGVIFIIMGLILARAAAHYAYPTPDMGPERIWHGMSPALKSVVLAGALLFASGCRMLITGFFSRTDRPKERSDFIAKSRPAKPNEDETIKPTQNCRSPPVPFEQSKAARAPALSAHNGHLIT